MIVVVSSCSNSGVNAMDQNSLTSLPSDSLSLHRIVLRLRSVRRAPLIQQLIALVGRE